MAKDPSKVNGSIDGEGAIQRDIERTRTKLGGTIGELHDRLKPGHLVAQAKTTVKQAAVAKARQNGSTKRPSRRLALCRSRRAVA